MCQAAARPENLPYTGCVSVQPQPAPPNPAVPLESPVSAARATGVEEARRALRPVRPVFRVVYAHWVTALVVASYLSLKLQSRLRSPAALERITSEKHRRNARRIERAIVRLQGLFIKVGQLISIMTNFLPEEFRTELARLQDQVPPRPFRDIEVRFREEFGGRGPLDVFAEFDKEPIASASIGQVHLA